MWFAAFLFQKILLIFLQLHRLFFPIGEATPYPFKWSEAEIAQPDGGENNLENPYSKHHIVHLVKTEFVVKAETISIKEKGTNNALHQVIGKGHLTHIGQRFH